MSRPQLQLPALAAILLGSLLWATSPDAGAAPRGPKVQVRTLERGSLEGEFVGLDATTLRLRVAGAAEDRALPLTGVIDVHLPAGAAAARGGEPAADELRLRARLVGGETLIGTYRGPSPEGILLEVHGLGTLPLSFEVVLSLETVSAKSRPARDTGRHYPRPEKGDLAYVGSDEFAGSVYEATEKGLVMEDARGRQREIPWRELQVAHLENEALEAAKGLQCEVETLRGSRIAAAGGVTLSGQALHLSLRSLPKKKLTVPLTAARALRWSGGAFVYATALPFESARKRYYEDPEGVMTKAFYEVFFGTRVDRRASGNPLRIGGVTYRHGFGVSPHNTITLNLDSGFRSFQAGFGVDDEVLGKNVASDKRGNLDARVLGDGKVLWSATDVQGGQPMTRIGPLDVSGVKQLVLEVGFGKELMMLDRADWVDPILVRK